MQSIAEKNIKEVGNGDVMLIGTKAVTSWHTPGHVQHHIAWQLESLIFTDEVAGVKINESPVVPPCPTPDVNIEYWKASITKLGELNPSILYLTYFGKGENVNPHFDQLLIILDD